jgi:hypothetical protein
MANNPIATIVGMYFIEDDAKDHSAYRTGQIVREFDGGYLIQVDSNRGSEPIPPALEAVSADSLTSVCDGCGSVHWKFFPDIESREKWIAWMDTPDPEDKKKPKIVALKHHH